jgi:hypothetical protein
MIGIAAKELIRMSLKNRGKLRGYSLSRFARTEAQREAVSGYFNRMVESKRSNTSDLPDTTEQDTSIATVNSPATP